ncbi:AAA family ATPase [Chitinophaga oryziterrae]|uniref:AAA family ATPase n=1 Tax=Chitinophaga oryziterrae TaxID=1031224 RepID=A0A6N8JLK8_9BACT|nr:ATP-binding protein [Chitinophaga oryziterrae]MVT45062.1 AAA family ATPase [Chitinophaga oryziterrae]
MIKRAIYDQIISNLFKGKAIIITGPRQVGKTTLLQAIMAQAEGKVLYLNCDEPDIRPMLTSVSSTSLKALIGDNTLVLIDEAQRVKNIGLTLKLLVDNFKDIQVIATGSSALELANEINEPLTGRKREYHLYPFSTKEMVTNTTVLQETRLLEQRMIYGFYPDIVNSPADAQANLLELTNNYLFKDVLSLQDVRKPALLERLLVALALQVGSEISYNEIGKTIGTDNKTVDRYIELLEKCFVVFQVGGFSRNLRNEIKKGKKIYFYDNGIRNALIKNFSPLELRQDIGSLFENFLVSERMKANHYRNHYVNTYFWRTHQQQEVDLIEESGGKLYAWEFKWNEKAKAKIPQAFMDAYPGSITNVMNRTNYMEFVNI